MNTVDLPEIQYTVWPNDETCLENTKSMSESCVECILSEDSENVSSENTPYAKKSFEKNSLTHYPISYDGYVTPLCV